MSDKREVCETCYNWRRNPDRLVYDEHYRPVKPHRFERSDIGRCCRDVPTADADGDPAWPRTMEDDWCRRGWEPLPP